MADVTRLQRTALTGSNCNRGELGNMNREKTDGLAFQTITTELSLVPKGDRT